jgi:hypothetical protein
MRQIEIRRGLPFLIAMLCVTLGSCATQGGSAFVVVLPNGYLIDRDKTSQTRIVKRAGGVVVPGPIAAYAVFRDVVTGSVSSPAAAAVAKGTPGADKAAFVSYFVLDTASGKVDKDLDAAAWNNRLKALGAPASPDISPPILPEAGLH